MDDPHPAVRQLAFGDAVGDPSAPDFVATPAIAAAGPVPVRTADIVIVGGGLAGSTAAVALGRTNLSVALVDPRMDYPADFRCEKLDPSQFRLMRRLGLGVQIERAATRCGSLWVAHRGRLVDRMPIEQYAMSYGDLVAAVRRAIPPSVAFVRASALSAAESGEGRIVELSNGEAIRARLVIVATGLNEKLKHRLGIETRVTSEKHSTSVGFDLVRTDGRYFGFDALTFFATKPSDRMAYVTLFRMDGRMRANLMAYRSPADPWFEELRAAPALALATLWPGLAAITGDVCVSAMTRPRPADLVQAARPDMAGLVLVGDAFSTSCPAAGTGTSKLLNDIERLCAVHVPNWFADGRLDAAAIGHFYDDPCKQAVDRHSTGRAFGLRRISMDDTLTFRFRRLARFVIRRGRGMLRRP